jgi:hypothetical protein
MCEGPGKPVLRDLAVEVRVLHIKSDTLIVVSLVKYSSIGIVSHDLISYGI